MTLREALAQLEQPTRELHRLSDAGIGAGNVNDACDAAFALVEAAARVLAVVRAFEIEEPLPGEPAR